MKLVWFHWDYHKRMTELTRLSSLCVSHLERRNTSSLSFNVKHAVLPDKSLESRSVLIGNRFHIYAYHVSDQSDQNRKSPTHGTFIMAAFSALVTTSLFLNRQNSVSEKLDLGVVCVLKRRFRKSCRNNPSQTDKKRRFVDDCEIRVPWERETS